MKRRDFFRLCGRAILGGGCGAVFPILPSPARATSPKQVGELRRILGAADGEAYTRDDQADYGRLLTFYNKRFECVRPDVLIYCTSARGVAKALRWCKVNGLPFAVRSGGHSYEGLSRSRDVVIDVRGLNRIDFRPREHALRVGAGVSLGDIYRTIAPAGHAIPAGTCPTVGIAGHVTGGGIGFLVRQLGLASDSLTSVELVAADGGIVKADGRSNSDLFWALRGGGQGSFGIITRMEFRTHEIRRVHTYNYKAEVAREQAVEFMVRWQDWIDTAPKEISSVVDINKTAQQLAIEVKGLTTGDERALQEGLEPALRMLDPGARLDLVKKSFLQTFRWFSDDEYFPPTYEKGKSDVVKRTLGPPDWSFILEQLPEGVDVEISGLGGAMREIDSRQTAFPHRGDSKLVIQWGISWQAPEQAPARMNEITDFYARIRPQMSSAAYLNYADCDIDHPGQAYWGVNLPRLIEVKRKYDPRNIFRHALSVPLHAADLDAPVSGFRCV